MKKIMLILVAMAFMAFGFAAGASAAGMDKSIGKEAKDVSALIGKDVVNMEGETLGEVRDFIHDENGEISLAILSHGGFMGMGEKDVAVPYSALSFSESEDHFVLNVSKDQLAGAPEIRGDENLSDRSFAEEVYRYFGERPYWTDEGTGTREYFGADEDTSLEPEADADLDADIEMKRDESVENF
jgi:sporulation protein YlmC with PRC-barrel domain